MMYIGNTHNKALEIFQKHGLKIFRNILTTRDFKTAIKETVTKKTRKRALIPEVVVWIMMLVSLECISMNNALSKFWEEIRLNYKNMPLKAVSAVAFF